MTARGGALTLAVVLLSGVMAGCGADQDQSLLGKGPTAAATTATGRAATPQQLLDRRAAAVLAGDEGAFLAPVARRSPGFLAAQRRLYANLRQLPISALSYRVSATHRVRRSLTLRGFDSGPVVGPAGFEVRRQGGNLSVVPAVAADERGTDPWDLVPIRVRTSPTVLLVADADTAPNELRRVVAAVTDGISAVASVVPSSWDGKAVVYLFRDPAVLASYSQVPGGNLERLGALTFPARGGDEGHQVVGGRVALLPSAVGEDDIGMRRLVRHELTHLALGAADDDAPTWLVEGIAEYVVAKPLASANQRIATAAIARAQTGFGDLPAATRFNDDAQDVHYAEAWMACDYLSATRGEAMLFDLLTAMDRARVGHVGRGQEAVLEAMVGLDTQQLAAKAAQRILRLFGPPETSSSP